MAKTSKLNPADGKMSVENGQSVYLNGEYKVVFTQLPMNYGPGSLYIRLQNLKIFKNNKKIIEYVISQESKMNNMQVSLTYFLEVLEPTGDSFTLRTFNAFPDPQLSAVSALEEAIKFEETSLNGMDAEEFSKLKTTAIDEMKKLYPQSRFYNFKGTFGNFFLFVFEPQQTYYNHYIGVAYDYKNKRFYFLTNMNSLAQFLTKNKLELVGSKKKLLSNENLPLLTLLFKITAENAYSRFIADSEQILLTSPYNTHSVTAEFPARIEKYKKLLIAPKIEEGSFILLTVERSYPSTLLKWTIAESSGKYSIKKETLVEDLYLPDFIRKDPVSPEDGQNYIR
jgi:hypothetical protein